MFLIAEARAQEAATAPATNTAAPTASASPFGAAKSAEPSSAAGQAAATDAKPAESAAVKLSESPGGTALTLAPAPGSEPLPEEAPKTSPLMSVLPLAAVFAIFYFFVIRPQNKRYKEHQQMQKGVKKGDRIVTTGGIIGKVIRIQDDGVLHVEIAEKTVVQIERDGVSRLFVRQDDSKPRLD